MEADLEQYTGLLKKAVTVFDEVISLYAPDRHDKKDWAYISALDSTTYRNALAERLADPSASVDDATVLTVSLRHYLNSHWADYQELPVANPEKRNQLEQLHAELESIINGLAQISAGLRTAAA